MTIDFECEECFRAYHVKDSLAGKQVRCKECGHRIRVPQLDLDEEYEEEFDDAYDSDEELPAFNSQKKSEQKFKINPQIRSAAGKLWHMKRMKKIWMLFIVLSLIGFFYHPKFIAGVMIVWALASVSAITIGILWLAANCFKTAPVVAIIMVLLPFIGFIGFSNRIDLFNDKNEPPFRLAWNGLWSFIAALIMGVIFGR